MTYYSQLFLEHDVVHAFESQSQENVRSDVLSLSQIHSDHIVRVESQDQHLQNSVEGDALLTTSRGLRVGVKTADCVPVLIVDHKTKTVSAVHAGWRGLHAQIIPKALQMFVDLGSARDDLLVAVGPCICAKHYEVGLEFKKHFPEELYPNAFHIDKSSLKLDLRSLAVTQIRQSGIMTRHIDVLEICTYEQCQLSSYRRDKSAGRQWSWIQG